MPAFTLTAGMRALLKQWGAIQSAASSRMGVAGAWSAVSEAGGITPVTGVMPSIFDMNQLYGLAAGNRNAAERFAGASPTAAITPELLGVTPAARTLAARGTSPTMRIRANYTYVDPNGTIVNTWVTIDRNWFTSDTKTIILATVTTQIVTTLATTTEHTSWGTGTLLSVGTVTLTWI